MVVMTALGKIGHLKALEPLARIISTKSIQPTIRSVAVYSLKRVARFQPVHIKPVLLSIIDNPAEAPEVRIAAVSVLPYAQPSTAELQKIAIRTWFEPSKQVASFIYSTLLNLKDTQVTQSI